MIRSTLIFALAVVATHNAHAQDAELPVRMNHIQVVATHNSYHLKPEEPLFSQVKQAYPDAKEWDYSHPPLDVQLDRGVRSFELDAYHDPEGTRVLHVPQFDKNSTCPTIVECLTRVRDWSKAHPNHVPIITLIELKDEQYDMIQEPILPFSEDAINQLDDEIREVFSEDHLLTPDDVRVVNKTLSKSLTEIGWPLLEDVRGKVMFVLHARGLHAEYYTLNSPNLEGRAMFLESVEDEPWASVFIRNNPTDDSIPRLVEQGYIVRTRADSGIPEGGDPERRDAALSSGAHIVTTDFPPGGEADYAVELPGGGPARCNPVNAPEGCDAIAE